MLFIFIIAVVYVVWRYRRSPIGRLPRDDLQGPPTLPLLGTLHWAITTADKMHDHLLRMTQSLGQTWKMDTLGFNFTIISMSPTNLQHMLKTNFDNYVKGADFYERFAPLLGNGIFNVDGEMWYHQRKVASNIFTTNNFQTYMTSVFLDMIERVTSVLDDAAQSGRVVCLSDLFYRFTFDSFCKIAFGVDFFAITSDNVPFLDAFDKVQLVVSNRFVNPMWKLEELVRNVWTWSDPLKENMPLIDEVVYGIIRDRRREPRVDRNDLLSLFMEADTEQSDKELHDVVLNFLLAGRDTTAGALCWTFHKLMGNPDMLDKLRQEASGFDLSAGPKEVFQAHKGLSYAHAVFSEVMRLYPSVPINVKTSIKDDVLPDGTRVEAGNYYCWNPWTMGRLEDIWGSDAKTFSPERWLTMDKPSPYKWPAFHAGPRSCLGQRMATLEAILCMSALTSRFNFVSTVDETVERDYVVGITLVMKKPIHVKVTRL
jgi:cytochrome P450